MHLLDLACCELAMDGYNIYLIPCQRTFSFHFDTKLASKGCFHVLDCNFYPVKTYTDKMSALVSLWLQHLTSKLSKLFVFILQSNAFSTNFIPLHPAIHYVSFIQVKSLFCVCCLLSVKCRHGWSYFGYVFKQKATRDNMRLFLILCNLEAVTFKALTSPHLWHLCEPWQFVTWVKLSQVPYISE